MTTSSISFLRQVEAVIVSALQDPGPVGSDVDHDIAGPGIGFSPVVDGGYVPDLPGILFSQGRYHKEVKDLIVGTMENEVRAQGRASYITEYALGSYNLI